MDLKFYHIFFTKTILIFDILTIYTANFGMQPFFNGYDPVFVVPGDT